MLLGDRNLSEIEFQSRVTVAELLEEIAARSSNALQFLTPGTRMLDEGWEVQINDRPFTDFPQGVDTLLEDGDRVTVNIGLICGG